MQPVQLFHERLGGTMRAVWTFIVVMILANVLCVTALVPSSRWHRRRRSFAIAASAFLMIELVAVAYGYLVEPRWLDERVVTIAIPADSAIGCVTIAHFSDLHSPSNAAAEATVLARIRAVAPDFVVFSGDVANTTVGVARARTFFSSLARIAPTYAIRGNRDVDLPADFFPRAGVRELRGERIPLSDGSPGLSIIGASRQADRRVLARNIRASRPRDFVIYVSHSPDDGADAIRWGADLVLAGHTHGGQIAFPIIGPLWTGARLGGRSGAGGSHYASGLLYITRGIGMEALFPKMRIGARPELTVIRLAGSTEVRSARFADQDEVRCR